jgi:hypothetical protein
MAKKPKPKPKPRPDNPALGGQRIVKKPFPQKPKGPAPRPNVIP